MTYLPPFRLWSVLPEVVALEEQAWERWVEWRSAFDRGEPTPPEELPKELSRSLEPTRTPTAEAILAVPEWRLDADRSYADGAPTHLVRWHICGDIPSD